MIASAKTRELVITPHGGRPARPGSKLFAAAEDGAVRDCHGLRRKQIRIQPSAERYWKMQSRLSAGDEKQDAHESL